MTALPPEQVLTALKAGARPQTCRALDVVSSVCAEAHKLGARDFSLATIGRLTEQRHGPSMRTLYNAKSAHYRALIKAWADYTAQTRGQPEIAPAKPLAEEDLLHKIDDPALRGVFGAMVAERNRLRSEVTLLRSRANIVVDRRVFPGELRLSKGQVMQVLTGSHPLLPLEKEALTKAGITPTSAEIGMVPQNYIKLTGSQATQMVRLVEALEEHDDVQHVYANFDIEESEIQAAVGAN